MIWVLILAVALSIFLTLVLVFKLPRSGWELVGTALCVGVAGYGLQGHPDFAGAPKAAVENEKVVDDALLKQRQQMGETFGKGQNWLILADGLVRNGQFGAAAQVLSKAVRENPKDADLWVALGNALVGHGDGTITPPATMAFERAAQISPQHPAPPFFFGLALAQSGRLPEARAVWADLLSRAPADAPWRADLEARIKRIDTMIDMMNKGTPPAGAAPSAPVAGANP